MIDRWERNACMTATDAATGVVVEAPRRRLLRQVDFSLALSLRLRAARLTRALTRPA